MQGKLGDSTKPTPEQVFYARVLEIGMYMGLVCLLVTFVVYVSGVMEDYVPVDDLPRHWQKKVDRYLVDTKIVDHQHERPGWSWITRLRYADFLNYVGIVILAGVTIVCYLAILPKLLGKKDFIYATLALLEILVLVAAASGIMAAGH